MGRFLRFTVAAAADNGMARRRADALAAVVNNSLPADIAVPARPERPQFSPDSARRVGSHVAVVAVGLDGAAVAASQDEAHTDRERIRGTALGRRGTGPTAAARTGWVLRRLPGYSAEKNENEFA